MLQETKDEVYALALTLVPGVGSIRARQIISLLGSAKAVFQEGDLKKLEKGHRLGTALIEELKKAHQYLPLAEKAFLEANSKGQRWIDIQSQEYPSRLKNLPDAPFVLFSRGKALLESERTVAIVGTRKPSHYGKDVTKDLVNGLKNSGCTIISGLAHGIDSIAHIAALEAGLPTIAVLGTDLNTTYPAAHKELQERIASQGQLVSEYPSGASLLPGNFIARNRLIAGLADVIVIVEAKEKGGAITTAEFGNDYDKEVMAVPGRITDDTSMGCLQLIKRHQAHLFTGVESLLELAGWQASAEAETLPLFQLEQTLQEDELKVIKYLQSEGETHLDVMARVMQLPVSELSALLLNLEFSGLVKALPGKKFAILKKIKR